MPDTGLQDKRVLITGANHGIGAATARAFAAEGARVVIHFLHAAAGNLPPTTFRALHTVKGRSAAEELVRLIGDQGGRAIAIDADLSDAAAISPLFDRAEEAWGPVDILVNNAAHCEDPDTILTTSPGCLDRTFDVNSRAGVLLISEFARRYLKRGGISGSIINLSTDAAQTFAGQIAYGASKAAIEAFTRSAAIELGPLGIRVNCVAPGPVQTGSFSAQSIERLVPQIPLRRMGDPEDIADVIVFLASRQARWLTGQVIKISGGHEI